MKNPSLGRKPTQQHILWVSDEENDIKRFHENYLKKWCRHFGFDFEQYTRVDHERAEEPRLQYQCVFSHQTGAGDSFEMGDEEWSIETETIPETFVEIDEEGWVRVQGWSIETVRDVVELRHEGPVLVIESRGNENQLRLDARDLTS